MSAIEPLEGSLSQVTLTASEGQRHDDFKPPCGICGRQLSRYTCPNCNLQYCSLQCFRSEQHNACAEGFYKREVESDIKITGKNGLEGQTERRRMLEMLREFENSAAGEEEGLEPDEEEDALSRALEGIDLDQTNPEELLVRLPPALRTKFLNLVSDPSSETAQSLAADASRGVGTATVWWNHRLRDANDNSFPEPIAVPPNMVTSMSMVSPLVYNVCAICLAYSYTVRTFSSLPLADLPKSEVLEARNTMMELVPFLTDKKSKLVHSSLDAAIQSVWSLTPNDSMEPALMVILLQDAAVLLRAPAVIEIPDSTATDKGGSHSAPDIKALSMISDIFNLERSVLKSRGDSKQDNHITHKLVFYAAHLLSTSRPALVSLSDDATARANRYKESARTQRMNGRLQGKDVVHGVHEHGKFQPKIEVIP